MILRIGTRSLTPNLTPIAQVQRVWNPCALPIHAKNKRERDPKARADLTEFGMTIPGGVAVLLRDKFVPDLKEKQIGWNYFRLRVRLALMKEWIVK